MSIIITNKKRTYQLTENNEHLGTLQFPKWYSYSAVIEMKRDKVELKQKGFWGNKYLIIRKGFTDGSIKINWKGHLTIEIKDSNKRIRRLGLMPRGMFNQKYELIDEKKKVLFTVNSLTSWKKFNNDYDIEVQEVSESLDSNLLYFYSCFCVTIYNSQIAAAGAVG